MLRQLITIPRNLSAVATRVLYVDAAGASEVVDLTAAIGAQPCRAGWDYRIFGGLEQPALATLTFLADYRT